MRSEYEFGRKRLRAFFLMVTVLAVAGYLFNWWIHHRPVGRPGSRGISSGTPFHIGTIPTSFYARFEVTTFAGGKPVVTTEKTWVERPFASRIETWSGTKLSSVRQSAFGAFANISPSSEPLAIAVGPSLGSGDLRVDVALIDAVRRHVIEKREKRNVYGRVCQIYRAGGPVSAGDLTTYRAGASEYADFCVDRDGIVIEEWWVRNNSLLRRRVARLVHVGRVRASAFRITVRPTPGMDTGSIDQVPDNDATVKLWTLAEAPKGFVHLGRFAVVLPSAASANPNPSPVPAPPTSSVTDVYTSGPNLVVVDQSPALASAAAAENRPTIKITIAGLRNAVLILDGRSNEVRADTPDGSFVRVAGTLAPSRLIALARSLRLTGGPAAQ